MDKINLDEKFGRLKESWSPRIVAELNGQYVKIARATGKFTWHKHDNEDELFLVMKGSLIIKLRNRDNRLDKGDLFVVPKGIEHKPVALKEAYIMLFEPVSTAHTGDSKSPLTVDQVEWI